jgi:hypothetical protein
MNMKKWLKENIFVKDMFLYILVAAIIFYIPTWVLFIYGFISGEEYLFGIGAGYILVWAGPFTPTIPVILAIAVFLKQLVKRFRKKGSDDDETIS